MDVRSPPNVGTSSTSFEVSFARCCSVPLRVSMFVSCDVTSSTELQRLAGEQLRRDVDGDHDVGPHLVCHVDGQVQHDAAVDEQPAVDLDRRQRRGNRHARANRAREAARAEHDGLARHDIAGHGAERDRELVEVVDLRRPQRLARDDHVDDLALHEPERQLELAVVEPGLLIDEERVVVALAPERLQLARRDVEERRSPTRGSRRAARDPRRSCRRHRTRR